MSGINLYNIPSHASFADVFAAGVIARYGNDPVKLSDILVLLPTRRAVGPIRDAFLRALGEDISLLPRMLPLGELGDDDTNALLTATSGLDLASELLPAMTTKRRQNLLMQQIIKWGTVRGEMIAPAHAWRLARDLGHLIDEANAEGVDLKKLADLIPEKFARHWQVTQDFLSIVTDNWPKILAAFQMTDEHNRRDEMLIKLADAWKYHPPKHPVIVAGSTGSQPANRKLLEVLVRMADGHVILPGFDMGISQTEFDALPPTHPQNMMKALLGAINVERDDIQLWHDRPIPQEPVRAQFLRDALRPAETTGDWTNLPYRSDPLKQHYLGLSLLEAPSVREEGSAIALAMREVLETPARTALLVTPDRTLAAYVRHQLARWDIEIDDSGGESGRESTPGRFLLLLADLAQNNFAPVPFMALLQHPFMRCGLPRYQFISFARRVDLMLRGPRPEPGASGLHRRLDKLSDEDKIILKKATDIIDPLVKAFTEQHSFTDLLTRHIETAERLAEQPEEDTGSDELWGGDGGSAIADELRKLLEYKDEACIIEGADYPALFSEFMTGITVRPKWRKHPRLLILGPLEARLQTADLVILGGLNEGKWPKELDPDPWMNRSMRYDLGLPDNSRRLGQSAHDFITLASGREILITRAEKEEGSPTVPSRWLYRIEALAASPIPRAQHYLSWLKYLNDAETVTPEKLPTPRPPVSARPKRLSVTQIQEWMSDPYSLYARKILNLKKLDPIDDMPNAATKGNLLHEALELFLKEDGAKYGEQGLARLLAIGFELFKEVETQPTVYAFWWPRFKRLAEWFVANEAERRDRFTPALIEAWGEMKLPGTDFTLFAKADRIDRALDGGQLSVIDYKTGGVPSKRKIEAGYAPQLPLEALLAERGAFEGLPPGEVNDLVYWVIKGGTPIQEEKRPISASDLRMIIDDAEEGLRHLIDSFNNENVPYLPEPRPGIFGYGDYYHLSRKGEWSDMDASELKIGTESETTSIESKTTVDSETTKKDENIIQFPTQSSGQSSDKSTGGSNV